MEVHKYMFFTKNFNLNKFKDFFIYRFNENNDSKLHYFVEFINLLNTNSNSNPNPNPNPNTNTNPNTTNTNANIYTNINANKFLYNNEDAIKFFKNLVDNLLTDISKHINKSNRIRIKAFQLIRSNQKVYNFIINELMEISTNPRIDMTTINEEIKSLKHNLLTKLEESK